MTTDDLAFGSFRLVVSRRVLERDGEAVPISSRAFEILQVLTEARDRVVGRDEIIARVWPGIAVEASNLTVQISALRRALGDTGAQPQLIATIPGRGYRFIAPIGGSIAVDETSPIQEGLPEPVIPPSSAPMRVRAALIAAACVACVAAALLLARLQPMGGPSHDPAAPPLSIVVMPLRDLSDRPGQAYLADAISDDLTTDLAHLPGSTVIARETADSYKGHAVPAIRVGRDLHVRYLLEGSVRAEDAALHVNAQLIDTSTGAHLWAQTFDMPRADPGAAREAIVRRIASSLDVELVEAESTRARRDRPDNPTALDLFFQARSILDHDDSLAAFRAAQSLLERAVALQPDFTDGLAELSSALVRKTFSVEDPDAKADAANARTLASRALSLSPRQPLALAARAQLQYLDGRIDEAAYAARSALAADPTNLDAQSVLAHCAWDNGRLDEAAQALETLLRLNPSGASNKPRLLLLAQIRLFQGNISQAVDLADRATAGDPSPSPGVDSWGRAEGARTLLISARALAGQVQQAQSLYAEFAQIWPHRTVWRIGAAATKQQAILRGFGKFLDALHAAGMPSHADEHVDDHLTPSAASLPVDEFSATPLIVPGATTIDTAGLTAMKRRLPALLIIDLGSGAAVIPGAIVRQPSEQSAEDADFIDAATRRAGIAAETPVVIMADGTYGSTSYNAALHLLAAGFRHVFWYRGGEEAWAASGGQAEDRRE